MNFPLSRRLPPDMQVSDFHRRSEDLRKLGPYTDLTLSSPHRTGLHTDLDMSLASISPVSALDSRQFAQGTLSARNAVATYASGQHALPWNPEQVWITASTSESYAALFQTFCDPGDSILIPLPGYPLLDALAGLANLHCHPYFLQERVGEWRIDLDSLESLPERTRILLVIAPHNPTGQLPTPAEWNALYAFCERHQLLLVIDEVFGAYGKERGAASARHLPASPAVPIIWLDGLSKSVGQPQLKVGWMLCRFPASDERRLQDALEYVLDATLGVSALSAALCAPLLDQAEPFQKQVRERLAANRNMLRSQLSPFAHVPASDSGWYACFRIADSDDETLCLDILRECRVLLQPGFFFDFTEDGWLIASLLPPEVVFAEAMARIAAYLDRVQAAHGCQSAILAPAMD